MPKKNAFKTAEQVYDRIWNTLAEQGYHSDAAKLKRLRKWQSLDSFPFLTMEQRLRLKAEGFGTPSSINAWFSRKRKPTP